MYEGWQRLRYNVGIIVFSFFTNFKLYFFFGVIKALIFIGFWCRNIIPYIRKYGKNPVTGAPLKQEDLLPLSFHKNSEGYRYLI